MEWARESSEREGDLPWLMAFLQREVERRERSEAFASPLPATKKLDRHLDSRPQHWQQPSTASALSAPSADRRTCAVHGAADHATKDCYRFAQTPLEERWDKVRTARLCFACLGDDHRATACDRRCPDCRGHHHRLLCKTPPESLEDRPSSPPPGAAEPAAPSLSAPPAPEPSNASSPVVAAPSTTAAGRAASLQTALVTVVAPDGRRVKATALLDSGSDRSYVSAAFVKKVRPECKGSTSLRYAPFGSGLPFSLDADVHEFSFCTNDDCLMMSFCEVPFVCAPLRRIGAPLSLLACAPTPLSDAFGEDRELVVDLLVGVDHYWTVMTGRSLRLSPSLMVQESRFGWVLSGSFATTQHQPQVSAGMLSVAPAVGPVRRASRARRRRNRSWFE